MKVLALTAAVAIAFAAQAQANDQIAAAVGVEPGRYTLNQLIQLRSAQENDEHAHFNQLINRFDTRSRPVTGISAGQRQLAASLGVEPGRYSLNQLVQLRNAQENDEHAHFNQLINRFDRQ